MDKSLNPTLTIHLRHSTLDGMTIYILEAIKSQKITLYPDEEGPTITYNTAKIKIDVLVLKSGQLNLTEPPDQVISEILPDITVK